jgi:hypothetical protein
LSALMHLLEDVFGALEQKHIVVSFPGGIDIMVKVHPSKSTVAGISMTTQQVSALTNRVKAEPRDTSLGCC